MFKSLGEVSQFRVGTYGLFVLLGAIVMSGCENPSGFDRNNRDDPQSKDFIPKISESAGLEVTVTGLNEIRLQWPEIFEIDHYAVSRSFGDTSGFKKIYKTGDFRDTSFVDRVPESGDYYYQVEMVAKNGSILTLESDRTLSNFVAGPELQFDPESQRLLGGRTFAMNLSESEILIHHYKPLDESPLFSKLNTDTDEWVMTAFDNLVSSRDHVHGFDFFYAGHSKLLVVNRFFTHQDFLAYSCDINSMNCVRVGEGMLEPGTQIRGPTFSLLDSGKVLVHVYTDRRYKNKNLTFSFDPSTNLVEEVSAPRDNQHFSTMSTFNEGGIIGCGFSRIVDGVGCQITEEGFQDWRYVSTPNIGDEDYIRVGSHSLPLNNGDIAFLYDKNEALRVYLYSRSTDKWTELQELGKPASTNHVNLFTNSLFQVSDGNLMLFHKPHKPSDRWDLQFAVELFSFDRMEWTETYILPDYIEGVHNFVEIGPDLYLVTYADEEYGIPRVGYFHAK